ncbi:MAG TPA: hypothetical protein VF272_01065 [Candidatus Saccharimonadia bacterium]
MFKILRNMAVVAVLMVGAYLGFHYQDQILDWYYLRGYTPPARVAELADKATMTENGRRIFYRAKPQMLKDRPSLVKSCRVEGEKTIELGCYLSTNQIFLLNIQQPDLKDEEIVTAAHEALHAVYDRMSNKERREINTRLRAAAATITDSSLAERLSAYRQLEPGEEDNELHSIIGTEYPNLSPELERHYLKYFTNRAQIVSYSQSFNQRFDGLHKQIVQLDAEIQAIKLRMRQYLEAGRISTHNALVPHVNELITEYNQKVEQYNQYASDLLGQQAPTGSE